MTSNEAIKYQEAFYMMVDNENGKEACKMAITALEEIQLYRDGKLCLVPEDVYSRQCNELDNYKEIETVDECREAVEKQKPKKMLPVDRASLLFADGWRYKCPSCVCAVGENIYHLDVTKDYEYCSMCGQRILAEEGK